MNLDDITSDDILGLYRRGLFPMAENATDETIYVMDPEQRGIIPLDAFHIPASLKKILKKNPFKITINQAFDDVIDSCAEVTEKRKETWINPHIRAWYKDLHKRGYAHSVECWDAHGKLAGGLYGVAIGAAFFGESMFSRQTNASRVALVYLVERLKARGYQLLDCQYVNPHLEQFGCIWISRAQYQSSLSVALSASGVSFSDGAVSSAAGSASSTG